MTPADRSASGVLILVVEANPITRRLTRVTLEGHGYRVLEAGDAREAIEVLGTTHPALIVLDLVLPDTTGSALLARVRATEAGTTVPIVLVTGLATQADELRDHAGHTAVILKPVDATLLVATVDTLLAHSRNSATRDPTQRSRVLVVDDDPQNLTLARAWLSVAGFDVIAARSAKDALTAVRTQRPAAILADVFMPEQDGFQLCVSVRGEPAIADIPVVLVSSALTDERDVELARDAGAFALVLRSPTLEREAAALGRAIVADGAGVWRAPRLPQSAYLDSLRRQLGREADVHGGLLRRSAIQSAALSLTTALAQAFAQPEHLAAVIGDVLVHCLDAAGLWVGLLYVRTEDGELRLQSSCGLDQRQRERADIAFGRLQMVCGPSGDGASEPIALTRATSASEAHLGLLDELSHRSALIIPLALTSSQYGALVLASDEHDLSDATWTAFGRTLALQFGQAVALASARVDLSTSERRYGQLFHSEPIPTFVCDASSLAIIDVNPSAVTRYGYTREAFLSLRLPDLHVASEHQRVDAYLAGNCNRLSRASEWAHRTRDGATFEVELTCSPLDDPTRPLVLVAAYDISERKRAEALFRTAVHVSPNGLVMVDRAGTILMINRQIEAIFGYSESELLGRPVDMLLPSMLREAHGAHLQRYLGKTIPRRMGAGRELFGVHQDGHHVPIEIDLAPTTRGTEALVLASVTDITERRLAQQSINDAATQWHALMEGAMDGIAIMSHDGVIIEVNRRMAEILERPIDDLMGQTLSTFFAPGAPESAREFEAAVGQASGSAIGVRLVRPNETFAMVDFTLSAMELGGQRLVLSVGRDVTEQRMLEQQYRQAQKMEAVGRLAGGVAHDFNNLLTAILGYAELLSTEMPEGSPAAADLDEVKRAANRAAGLTRQLLAFSRQQVLEPVVLNLNSVVAEVEKLLRRLIGADIALVTALAQDLGNVRADRGQLEQVLMNLAVNARDAMPSGGTLAIETANVELTEAYDVSHQQVAAGDYVMLALSDNGAGMTEEVRTQVFEPFFTTKEQGKGTGLGLSTVYGIIKQSGGFIWVFSEPGDGTTFKVYLPRVRATLEQSVRPVVSTSDVGGGETILLAEDDEMLRPLTRKVLQRFGYTVLDAPDTGQALAVARAHHGPIHLLVTDMVMPGETGRVLAQRLSKERPHMRVLFMSGYTDNAIGRNEQGSGRTAAFLQKPFTPDVLGRKVRETLAL